MNRPISMPRSFAFQKRGNQVIISGRRKANLDETTTAYPGMKSVELDICDPASIKECAARLIAEHPKLNILINNAGVMLFDDLSGPVDETMLVSTVTTNLLGPIRMTGALIDHIKQQKNGVVIRRLAHEELEPKGLTLVESGLSSGRTRFVMKDTATGVVGDMMDFASDGMPECATWDVQSHASLP